MSNPDVRNPAEEAVNALEYARKLAESRGVKIGNTAEAIELVKAEKDRVEYVIRLLEDLRQFQKKK